MAQASKRVHRQNYVIGSFMVPESGCTSTQGFTTTLHLQRNVDQIQIGCDE